MRPAIFALACVACAADDVEPAAPAVVEERVTALNTLDFARASDDGVARGFDLDGDDGACGFQDYTDPEGRPGVDNAFAGLLPVMETVGGAAFEDLIQGAVDSGEFLLLLRVREDGSDCAAVELLRASEPPLVGADGALLEGQTIPVRDEPMLSASCARYEDERTLLITDSSLPLQLQIFDAVIDLRLEIAALRIHLEDDGSTWGETGGALNVEDLWGQVGVLGGIGAQLLGVLETVLFQRADISVDGGETCSHMSAALAFEAKPAFVYAGEAP